MTTFEYEGDRVVRSVTVREPEWSPDELAVMLEFLHDEREPRGSHGHRLSEAMSVDANPQRRDAKYRYVAEPGTDFAAQALVKAQQEWQRAFPDGDASTLLWSVKRVEVNEKS